MKEKKFHYCVPILFGILTLLLSFSLFFLLYNESIVLSMRSNENKTKEYISLLSPWIVSSISFSGLILGFFYYMDKQKNEFDKDNEKCQEEKYKFLLGEIDFCDEIIEKLYHKKIPDCEIKLSNDNLTKHCILITKYFEDNNTSLLLKNGIPNPLSRWNSFINTAEIVRIRKSSDVDSIRSDERSEYENKYSEVKTFLLNSIC